MLKYFLIHVTTQYDGMEWGQKWLIKATNTENAIKRASKQDFTHGDGIEVQEVDNAWEITKEEANVIEKTRACYWL